ncbi:MAG: PQQ-binding-like beta-propeller repeat protein, partial [Pirellulaceae bacterium]
MKTVTWSLLLVLLISGPGMAVDPPQLPSENWFLPRGNSQAQGVSQASITAPLTVDWKFKVKDGAFEGTPAIVNNMVYIGDLDGKLFGLDLKTGKKRWEYTTDSGFIASPAVRDGRIYLGDIDGRFYCVDAITGKKLWIFETRSEEHT